MGKSRKSLIIVLCIIAVAFNMISFLLPGRSIHPVSFWMADLFMIVAIGIQYYILTLALGKYKGALSKVYGYPILTVGIRYVYFQFLASCITIVLCTIGIRVPAWIILVVSIGLIAYASVGVILVDQARDTVEAMETNHQKQTFFMHKLSADIKSMIAVSDNEYIKEQLEQLAEEIRYSDPVSCEEIQEEEAYIAGLSSELARAVSMNTPNIDELIRELLIRLKQRNEHCSIYKRRSSSRGTSINH